MSYSITLIHPARYPILGYGGTERVVWWLAKGLSELGHRIKLIALPGSHCPFAEIVDSIPEKSDILHYFNTPQSKPERPYLVTIGGNAKIEEKFFPNTVFVSQDHAKRHRAEAFVYNGLDPDEYEFSEKKSEHLLFLAKASWSIKNVKGAIRIARRSGKDLDILGGGRWWLPSWRKVHWRGMLGGPEKAVYIRRSCGLLFPVLWNEPFGIAVIEALVSGTPVLATPFGSLKELVNPEVGRLCSSYSEFVSWVGRLGEFRPKKCRDWALSQFHYREMAKKYVTYYERILSGELINKETPRGPSQIEATPFFLPEN